MPGYEIYEEVKDLLSSATILESFIQYMTDDQLKDFCEQLKKDYDL